MSALLAAVAALLVAAAMWELIGERGERASTTLRRRLPRLAASVIGRRASGSLMLGAQERIDRAALGGRLNPQVLLLAKLASAVGSVPLALVASPAAPGGSIRWLRWLSRSRAFSSLT